MTSKDALPAAGPHGSKWWRERRARDAARAGLTPGRGYLYRAGDVLVAAEDEARLAQRLSGAGGRPDEPLNDRLDRGGLQVRRWLLPQDTDVPSLIDALQDGTDVHHRPGVAPNHGWSGEPFYHGGPGGLPRPAAALVPQAASAATPKEPQLAVMDTGVARDIALLHPDLLAQLRPDADDWDQLDSDGDGMLDAEAGHGTFICGLVHRLQPGLAIDPELVLTPYGFGDDIGLALALMECTAPVINLSLGGYTHGNQPPLATEAALRRLGCEVAVVAAAGNHASNRPFWPAASKQVLAVAALDTTGAAAVPAAFSNYGWWVDIAAPGVDLHSAYVKGARVDAEAAAPEAFNGWACWSGTSFAAPLVASAIAAKVAAGGTPAVVAAELLASLPPLPGYPDYGRVFDPGIDLVCRRH